MITEREFYLAAVRDNGLGIMEAFSKALHASFHFYAAAERPGLWSKLKAASLAHPKARAVADLCEAVNRVRPLHDRASDVESINEIISLSLADSKRHERLYIRALEELAELGDACALEELRNARAIVERRDAR